MPSRSPATDRKQQQDETADSSYFAPLAQGRYFLLTTSRPKGAPVSVRVPGVVDGARAYVQVWDGPGTGRRLRPAGEVQVTACEALHRFAAHIHNFAAKQHSTMREFGAGFGGVALVIAPRIQYRLT